MNATNEAWNGGEGSFDMTKRVFLEKHSFSKSTTAGKARTGTPTSLGIENAFPTVESALLDLKDKYKEGSTNHIKEIERDFDTMARLSRSLLVKDSIHEPNFTYEDPVVVGSEEPKAKTLIGMVGITNETLKRCKSIIHLTNSGAAPSSEDMQYMYLLMQLGEILTETAGLSMHYHQSKSVRQQCRDLWGQVEKSQDAYMESYLDHQNHLKRKQMEKRRESSSAKKAKREAAVADDSGDESDGWQPSQGDLL